MEPTGGCSILDLMIKSDENMIKNVSVGKHFSTSDNKVISWGLAMEQTQEVKAYEKILNFFKTDYDLKEYEEYSEGMGVGKCSEGCGSERCLLK